MLDVDVELAGLERFEGNIAVAVELDFHAIEVVLAAIDRQVLAPVILDPFEDQLSARRTDVMRYGPLPSGASKVVALKSRCFQ
jgi:hypothetical protein